MAIVNQNRDYEDLYNKRIRGANVGIQPSADIPTYLNQFEIRDLLKKSKAWNLEALRFLIEQDQIDSKHEKYIALYELYKSQKKFGDLPNNLLIILGKIINDSAILELLVKVAHDKLSKYKSAFDGVNVDTDSLSMDTSVSAFDLFVNAAERIQDATAREQRAVQADMIDRYTKRFNQ